VDYETTVSVAIRTAADKFENDKWKRPTRLIIGQHTRDLLIQEMIGHRFVTLAKHPGKEYFDGMEIITIALMNYMEVQA
jgi:hypothetical protein